MTPAQIWGKAYLTEWQLSRNYMYSEGYDLHHTLLNGETVKEFCDRRALDFAELARSRWLQSNPNWLEELCKTRD